MEVLNTLFCIAIITMANNLNNLNNLKDPSGIKDSNHSNNCLLVQGFPLTPQRAGFLTPPLRHRRRATSTSPTTHFMSRGEAPSGESSSEEQTARLLHSSAPSSAEQNTRSMVQLSQVQTLQEENDQLRASLKALQAENERLQASSTTSRIVLENFEGEFSGHANQLLNLTDVECAIDDDDDDESEGHGCPVEPSVTFGEALRDRAVWLVGLLIFQSVSGIILANNEALLERHPVSKYKQHDKTTRQQE